MYLAVRFLFLFLNIILMFMFIFSQGIYLYRLSMVCFSFAIVFRFGLMILKVTDIRATAVVVFFLKVSRTLCFPSKFFLAKGSVQGLYFEIQSCTFKVNTGEARNGKTRLR